MGRTTGFLGLGLLQLRMGVQDGRSAHRRLDRRNEKSVRKAVRQGVRISCLRRTPESQEPQKLSHSDAVQNGCSPLGSIQSHGTLETNRLPLTAAEMPIAVRRASTQRPICSPIGMWPPLFGN